MLPTGPGDDILLAPEVLVACDEGCGGGGGGGDIVRFPTTAIPETIKVLLRQSV